MCPKYPLVLIFGIILSLPHPSSSQNWEMFQKKHIVGSASMNCDDVMKDPIFIIKDRCKKLNTFIVSPAATVKTICSAVPSRSDVTSSAKFQLINCILKSGVKPPCPYESKSENNFICIRCENRLPVHFVKMGKC
ncbi:PREDICTED: sialic acid-binding lectin-like [Nanorana parkeri]|uniref:sialic acid-binding lectin-like n=1 Tax=Nanorana parkeri TaxID=125878 RepID=UPI000854B7A4|nr:PREDICTED: sialic acid-binding lectin-like [Nanorana parkeri]